jgi:hypothetical protein
MTWQQWFPRLGYLQRHMLEFCVRYPGRHTIAPDAETVRIAQSLQRRGLVRMTNCGMCTNAGRTVWMVQATERAIAQPTDPTQTES